MADTTDTLVTASSTTLTAFTMLANGSVAYANQLGDVNNIVKYPNAANKLFPGAISNGFLYVPNRGHLMVLPGDVIAVDNKGWPILVSKYSIANGNWTYV